MVSQIRSTRSLSLSGAALAGLVVLASPASAQAPSQSALAGTLLQAPAPLEWLLESLRDGLLARVQHSSPA